MARVLIIIAVVALSIYALIDVARTDSNSMPVRLSKPVWLALVLLVPVIGPAIWLYFKYQDVLSKDATFGANDLRDRFSAPKSNRKKGPVAPDDDPEFLARLDAQNRRRAWEAQRREEEGLDDLDEHEEENDHRDDDGPEGGLYGAR